MTTVAPRVADLPDLFRFQDGAPVASPADWPRRRQELLDAIVPLLYGGLPPTPSRTRFQELHSQTVTARGGIRFVTAHVHTEPTYRFLLSLLIPPGPGPFPVVLTGDGCWRYVTEAVETEVLGRGCILAQFNRDEIVPDVTSRPQRDSGLYLVYPQYPFGALAAWAWGYHRCVDALQQVPQADPQRIAIVGHSRGGKATLLAGATDTRIALVGSNNSGAGGAGCYRVQGPQSERLADLMKTFPYWFGPRMPGYVGAEATLPFDQHFLKAAIAPRPLITTEARDDLWANPLGTRLTHDAAAEAYRLLGVPERIAIHFRDGPHRHGHDDWCTFLNFADWHWHGKPRPTFNINPTRPA